MLPLGRFQTDKSKTDGHRPECRDCRSDARRKKYGTIHLGRHRPETPMMSNELFDHLYRNDDLRGFVKDLARQRSRGNDSLMRDMIDAAWIRIAFQRSGFSTERLKEIAERAIECERKKHWARHFYEGITFQELLSAEEWAMWTTGCGG